MTKHPAKYTDALLPVFGEMLKGSTTVLDPFAGTGKIHRLREMGGYDTIGVEIEKEWAVMDPRTRHANALYLPFDDATITAVCVSPVYGNRFSDHHKPKDNSIRRGYTHDLGRDLHPDNSGVLHFGRDYCVFHDKAWTEAKRVLVDGGIFVLNVKDFFRNRKRVRVTLWHLLCLTRLGFVPEEHVRVPTPSLRFGKNGESRIPYESVIKFRRM